MFRCAFLGERLWDGRLWGSIFPTSDDDNSLFAASRSQVFSVPDCDPARTSSSLLLNCTHSTGLVCPDKLWKNKNSLLTLTILTWSLILSSLGYTSPLSNLTLYIPTLVQWLEWSIKCKKSNHHDDIWFSNCPHVYFPVLSTSNHNSARCRPQGKTSNGRTMCNIFLC